MPDRTRLFLRLASRTGCESKLTFPALLPSQNNKQRFERQTNAERLLAVEVKTEVRVYGTPSETLQVVLTSTLPASLLGPVALDLVIEDRLP
jgi:hypothetical protein